MRIIAGTLRGRRLEAPSWPGLRPTSDKLPGDAVQCAGPHHRGRAGARCVRRHGRGGDRGDQPWRRPCHVIDSDTRAVALITRNLTRCAVADDYAIIRADLGSAAVRIPQADFDYIFLDPRSMPTPP